ncbi:MAG TPA: hypothetical protein VFZ12_03945 [Dehalococcoidia bacterium]|nr:hypothetical protein [Dehalococcoidia bacterium]
MPAQTTNLARPVAIRTDFSLPGLALPRPVDSRNSESMLSADLPMWRLKSGLVPLLGSLLAVRAVIALLALLATL